MTPAIIAALSLLAVFAVSDIIFSLKCKQPQRPEEAEFWKKRDEEECRDECR